jgi:ankyrin repeat protein
MHEIQECEKKLVLAIEAKDAQAVNQILQEHRHSLTDRVCDDEEAWICLAARSSSVEVVNCLLDAGFDINALDLPEEFSALDAALDADNEELVGLLLKRGADPNLGRPMISALSSNQTTESSLRYVQLLLKHGADINKKYEWYGDPDELFTALDFCTDERVSAYLRKLGAKSAK